MRTERNLIEMGLERWQQLAELLNSIIEQDGGIERDDERIWKPLLHTWTNEDWALVLHAFETLMIQHPNEIKSYQETAFIDAREALIKGFNASKRVLDKKANKHREWRMAMVLREVWNQINNISLPNNPASKRDRHNHYQELFQ